MTAPSPEPGPWGLGEFDADNFPGQGSGEPTTEMNGLDIRINSNVLKRIFARCRLAGFNHGMTLQDVLDSVGGVQTLHDSLGGLTIYAFASNREALQLVGIGEGEDETETGTSLAVVTIRAMVKDLADPHDNATGVVDNANAHGWKNGQWQRLFMKGNGELVQVLGRGSFDPVLLCETGAIHLAAGSTARWHWGLNREVNVSGLLVVESVNAPGGWLRLGGLPFLIASDAGEYVPLALWMNYLNPQPAGQYQGLASIGTNQFSIDRLDYATGQAAPAAAAIRAGTQIGFQASFVHP